MSMSGKQKVVDSDEPCRKAYNDFYHKIRAEVGYDHWRSIWSFIAKRLAAPVSAEPVAEVVVNGDGSQTWVALRTQWLPSGRHKLYAAPVAAQAQPDSDKAEGFVAAIVAERLADKVDAERYRFIRDGEQDVWCSSGDWPLSGDELDAAIDESKQRSDHPPKL